MTNDMIRDLAIIITEYKTSTVLLRNAHRTRTHSHTRNNTITI